MAVEQQAVGAAGNRHGRGPWPACASPAKARHDAPAPRRAEGGRHADHDPGRRGVPRPQAGASPGEGRRPRRRAATAGAAGRVRPETHPLTGGAGAGAGADGDEVAHGEAEAKAGGGGGGDSGVGALGRVLAPPQALPGHRLARGLVVRQHLTGDGEGESQGETAR
jgi:hypothetical protein